MPPSSATVAGSRISLIANEAGLRVTRIVKYRINVQDLGRREGTYQLISDDYDSGEQILRGGNIQIRRR